MISFSTNIKVFVTTFNGRGWMNEGDEAGLHLLRNHNLSDTFIVSGGDSTHARVGAGCPDSLVQSVEDSVGKFLTEDGSTKSNSIFF